MGMLNTDVGYEKGVLPFVVLWKTSTCEEEREGKWSPLLGERRDFLYFKETIFLPLLLVW